MTRVHQIKALRGLFIPLLARFGDRDITIRHAWHPERRMRVNLFRHKGYWFHRKARERSLMQSLTQLLPAGGTAVEIGCHIGWITVHLARLVGDRGKVYAFEPSPGNLVYLEDNTKLLNNVEIIRMAASNAVGQADFFTEALTGQNDTLIKDYEIFSRNKVGAFSDEKYTRTIVNTTSLDHFLLIAMIRFPSLRLT